MDDLAPVNLEECEWDPEALSLTGYEFSRRHKAIPIRLADEGVVVAMADPFDAKVRELFELVTGRRVIPVLADGQMILAAIERLLSPRPSSELDLRDPVESDPDRLPMIRAAEREAQRQLAEVGLELGMLGYCHWYWPLKKRLLKERYGLDWRSPADMVPEDVYITFD